MKLILNMLRASALLVVASNISASESESASGNRDDYSNGWYLSVGNMNLDEDNAEDQQIGSTAINFVMAYEGHSNNLIYAAGINFLFLSDKDGFSQSVEYFDGDRGTESSSALAFGAFGEVGYSHVFESKNSAFDLLAGVEFLTAERSIASCSDCYSENINLDSGLYIKPKLSFYASSSFVFSLTYQHYLNADIKNGIGLNFGWQY